MSPFETSNHQSQKHLSPSKKLLFFVKAHAFLLLVCVLTFFGTIAIFMWIDKGSFQPHKTQTKLQPTPTEASQLNNPTNVPTISTDETTPTPQNTPKLPSATPQPTSKPTLTSTPGPTTTPAPTSTPSPAPSPTSSPAPTATAAPVPSVTPSPLPTATLTPTP